MNKQVWNGLTYDNDKLNTYLGKLEEKITSRLDGYCTCCGAVKPSGEIGIANCCMKILLSMLFNYSKVASKEDKATLDKINLDAWNKKVMEAKRLYIQINTKNGDMKTPKNFKSDFKRNFFDSMLTAERISRKQLDVMEKDINHNYDIVDEYHEFIESVDKAKVSLLRDFIKSNFTVNNDFGKYASITLAKAWI